MWVKRVGGNSGLGSSCIRRRDDFVVVSGTSQRPLARCPDKGIEHHEFLAARGLPVFRVVQKIRLG